MDLKPGETAHYALDDQGKAHLVPPPYGDPRRVSQVHDLARDLLVSAYSAGLPIQGEDVRTVVRQARLFYDELENPTEPPAPPQEQESEDD